MECLESQSCVGCVYMDTFHNRKLGEWLRYERDTVCVCVGG